MTTRQRKPANPSHRCETGGSSSIMVQQENNSGSKTMDNHTDDDFFEGYIRLKSKRADASPATLSDAWEDLQDSAIFCRATDLEATKALMDRIEALQRQYGDHAELRAILDGH